MTASGSHANGEQPVVASDSTGLGFSPAAAERESVATADGFVHPRLTAVIVSHGPDSDLLYQSLRSVLSGTVVPRHIVLAASSRGLVDESAIDSGLRKLSEEYARGAGVTIDFQVLGSKPNFASYVKAALEAQEPEVLDPALEDVEEWLWLLHADSSAAPTTLEELLNKAETSNRIGVVGPKQVDFDADGVRFVREAGIRATRLARRVPRTRVHERDQGQFDYQEDVLGVGSAGMLVRRSVYDELGGLSTDFGPFGDGLEFSQRVWRAGYRVVLASRAQLIHQARSYGRGDDDAIFRRSFGARRRAQLLNALIPTPLIALLPLYLGMLLVTIPRLLWRLVMRDPRRAWGELRAGAALLGMWPAIIRGRRRAAAAGNARPLSRLYASEREVSRAQAMLRRDARVRPVPPKRIGGMTEKEYADFRYRARRGYVIAAALGLFATLAWNAPYLGAGALSGGAIAPDYASGLALMQDAIYPWQAFGAGELGTVDPFWLWFLPVLIPASLVGINLGQLASLSLILAPILAALSFYRLAGRFTTSWEVRVLGALAWLVAPAFLNALEQGRVAGALIHVALPLALSAFVRTWRSRRHALAALTLAGAFLSSAAPIYLALTLLATLIGLIFNGPRRARWLWLPVPALALMLPSLAQLAKNPQLLVGYLFSHAGPVFPDAKTPLEAVAGFPLQFEPYWHLALYGAVAVVAACALLAGLRLASQSGVLLGWFFAVAGLAFAAGALYVPVGLAMSEVGEIQVVTGWFGVGHAFGWLGLVLACVSGAQGLRSALRAKRFAALRIWAAPLAAIFALGLLATGAFWSYESLSADQRLVSAAPDQELPALAEVDQESDARSRVLVLAVRGDAIEAQVRREPRAGLREVRMIESVADAHELVAAGAPALSDGADAELAQAIANFSTGSARAASTLGRHAISIVLVPPADQSAEGDRRASLIAELNTLAGLDFVTENATGAFWRVDQPNAGDAAALTSAPRLRIVTAQPEATGYLTVPSGRFEAAASIMPEDVTALGEGPYYLVLSERASQVWQASVAGQALEQVSAEQARELGFEWANVWELPNLPAAGESFGVIVNVASALHRVWLAGVIVALGVTFIGALPIRSRKDD